MLHISKLIKLNCGVTIEIEKNKVTARQSPYLGSSQEEYSIVLTNRLWSGPNADDVRKGAVGENPIWKEVKYVGYSSSGGIYVHTLIDPEGQIESHNLRSLTNIQPKMVVIGEKLIKIAKDCYQSVYDQVPTR